MLGNDFVCSAKKGELIKNTVCNYTQEKLVRCIYLLTDLIRDVKFVSNKRVVIECTLVKMANPMFDESVSALLDRISVLEKTIKSGNFVQNEAPKPKQTTEFDGFEPPEEVFDNMPVQEFEVMQAEAKKEKPQKNTEKIQNTNEFSGNEYNKVINNWTEIIEEIQNQMHLTLYLNISLAIPKKSDTGITLLFPDRESKQNYDGAKQGELLSGIIHSVTGVTVNIVSAVAGEETYEQSSSQDDGFDIFSDIARHSGEFPENIHFE